MNISADISNDTTAAPPVDTEALHDHPLSERSRLSALARLNAEELVKAFKLDQFTSLQRIATCAVSRPAKRLAAQMMEFDRISGEQGLAAAGNFVLNQFARSVKIMDADRVPATGPLLVVSNHPGMVDAMALWSGLERRSDLRVIAAEREILTLLPGTKQYLLFVPKDGSLTLLLRQAIAHLRRGGSLLTFPAGSIEPDPCIRASSRELCWSSSVRLFAKAVPDLAVLPAAVGGVISPSALRNPLVALFKNQKERDWVAATLQILLPRYRDTTTRVAFGEPIAASALRIDALIERVRSLLDRVSEEKSAGDGPMAREIMLSFPRKQGYFAIGTALFGKTRDTS